MKKIFKLGGQRRPDLPAPPRDGREVYASMAFKAACKLQPGPSVRGRLGHDEYPAVGGLELEMIPLADEHKAVLQQLLGHNLDLAVVNEAFEILFTHDIVPMALPEESFPAGRMKDTKICLACQEKIWQGVKDLNPQKWLWRPPVYH